MAIKAQRNRVNIFGMFHQIQVIISKFDALFNISCLAAGLSSDFPFGGPLVLNGILKVMMVRKLILISIINVDGNQWLFRLEGYLSLTSGRAPIGGYVIFGRTSLIMLSQEARGMKHRVRVLDLSMHLMMPT